MQYSNYEYQSGETQMTLQQQLTINDIVEQVQTWLITGELNASMLASNFRFSSPYWQNANREEFLAQFADPSAYINTALSKITHFYPVIQLKDANDKYFAIVLQYHTKNNSHVYETVFGTIDNGLLVELRSIYDLEETKKAHDLE